MGVHKLALISYRYPKTIIVLWTLFLIFFGIFASKLPSVLKDHGLLADGAFAKVERILSDDFHIPRDPIILVFEKKESVSLKPFHKFIEQTLFQLRGIDGLSEVVSPLAMAGMLEGNYAYALLAFTNKPYEMKPVLEDIRSRLPQHSDISVNITGKSAVQEDVNQASQRDLQQAEMIGIPAAFIILLLAFRGIVTAIIPIVIGVIGVAGAMGIMYGIGTQVELSNFVLNVIPMVGLALSIDFALMLVSRFREELQTSTAEQAVIATMMTAGRAVFYSAASVFAGLTAILLIPLPIFTSVALGAMTVLTVSVGVSFTLLPALLSLLWPAIQAECKSKSLTARKPFNPGQAISFYMVNKPVRMLLLASLLLIGCLLPLSKMKLAIPDATSLPPSYASRQAAEIYQAHFVSPSTSNVYIAAQGSFRYSDNEDWMKTYALTQMLNNDPVVERVDSVFSALGLPPGQLLVQLQKPLFREKYAAVLQRFQSNHHLLLYVTLKASPSSEQAKDWLRRWEQQLVSSDIPYLLGGEAKYQQEVFDAIFGNIGKVFLVILVSNFLILFIAFRSVLIPLKTIAMNLLSLGASFGILVWVFAEGSMGMGPTPIAIMIPVFIFGLAFGISMDYGVFLVSRIFEVYQQTRDNERAVRVGLASTSSIITSAAAIMVAVTGPFAFADVVGVKQLGIGIAAAIVIDATLIRMIVVPSLMRLLGNWNWWAPGWLK